MFKKVMFLSAIAGSLFALAGCDQDMSYITEVPPASASNVQYGDHSAGSNVSYGNSSAVTTASNVSYGNSSSHKHHKHHRHHHGAPAPATVVATTPSSSDVHYGAPIAHKPITVATESQSSVQYGENKPKPTITEVTTPEDEDALPMVSEVEKVQMSDSSVHYGA